MLGPVCLCSAWLAGCQAHFPEQQVPTHTWPSFGCISSTLCSFKATHKKHLDWSLRHRHMQFLFPCFCPCPAYPFSSALLLPCYRIQLMQKLHLSCYLGNHFSSPACACTYRPSCSAMAEIESLGCSGVYELLQLLCQHLRHCLDFLNEL